MISRTSRDETRLNCLKIFKLKKEVIIRNIFDLNSREFAPQLTNVEDITNYIFESKGKKRINKL